MPVQIKSVNWWHERLADWLIANPDKTLKEAARVFDCTQTWISIVKNSDAFKAYWQQRSELASERNDVATIIAKTGALADMALDKLLEKVETQGDVLAAPFLLDVADTALRRLGYGAKPSGASPTPNVTVNVGFITAEKLAAAREKMKELHGVTPSAQLAEELPTEIPPPPDVPPLEGEILLPTRRVP